MPARAPRVVVTGRRQEQGEETVKLIRQAGGEGLFVRGDVAVEADVVRAIERTVERFGRLDIAFNNAGVELFAPLAETTADTYRRVFDINVLGTVWGIKHEVPALLLTGAGGKTTPGGTIVNMSSVAGQVGFPGRASTSRPSTRSKA